MQAYCGTSLRQGLVNSRHRRKEIYLEFDCIMRVAEIYLLRLIVIQMRFNTLS